LAELVLVLGIVVVAASVAIPRFAVGAARYRAQSAAHRVAADVAQARAVARAASRAVQLKFECEEGHYLLSGVVSMDRREPDTIIRLWDEPYRIRKMLADFGGGHTLSFDGHGAAASGGFVLLQGSGWTFALDVDGATGTVSVRPPTADELNRLKAAPEIVPDE
jgi:type II secretory pathway pseudopilin PulG